ncbi:MAG: beta-N-acetylhexosaminidase, partial [Gammaproteobacteria bacterium]|nr:beta-N-acetylhexosaminidase [Gammaproteobacteria bacterium]
MSLGPLMIDIEGEALTAEDREVLLHPLVGGVILFTRNFSSVEQLRELVEQIHSLRSPPLLLAVDQEGGRVQRFHGSFTKLPPARSLGEQYERNRKLGLRITELAGWLMATELRAVGVDISFAPVLDIDTGKSSVIGDRALHRRANAIAELARAWVQGMKRAGMAATGKHFP